MRALDESLARDFLEAVSQGDVKRAEQLLGLGVHPGATVSGQPFAALHLAAMAGNLEMLELLLAASESPDQPTCGGATALAYVVHELAATDDSENYERLSAACSRLLRSGASPTAGDPEQTPLYLAQQYGLAEAVTCLSAYMEKGGSSWIRPACYSRCRTDR